MGDGFASISGVRAVRTRSFFRGFIAPGGKIDYAANALVTEAVAAERASLAWLLRRRFRFGANARKVLMADRKGGME